MKVRDEASVLHELQLQHNRYDFTHQTASACVKDEVPGGQPTRDSGAELVFRILSCFLAPRQCTRASSRRCNGVENLRRKICVHLLKPSESDTLLRSTCVLLAFSTRPE